MSATPAVRAPRAKASAAPAARASATPAVRARRARASVLNKARTSRSRAARVGRLLMMLMLVWWGRPRPQAGRREPARGSSNPFGHAAGQVGVSTTRTLVALEVLRLASIAGCRGTLAHGPPSGAALLLERLPRLPPAPALLAKEMARVPAREGRPAEGVPRLAAPPREAPLSLVSLSLVARLAPQPPRKGWLPWWAYLATSTRRSPTTKSGCSSSSPPCLPHRPSRQPRAARRELGPAPEGAGG